MLDRLGAGACPAIRTATVHVDYSRSPLYTGPKSSSSTQAPTDAESTSKIIAKFKPLILGEVHTAGNITNGTQLLG
jgi:hypothetical protein